MTQKVVWVRQSQSGETGGGLEETASAGLQVNVRRLRFSAEIESRIDHLPPFPTILSELIGLTNSDKSVANDLRSCLEKDPVLTARLLRLANSAFYSPRVPVTSVQQAVIMLGHMTVKSLAMATATLKFLGHGAEAYGMAAGGLWMHSYASAELARELARALDWTDDEQDSVYVGALLHDIGKIVLAEIIAGIPGGPRYIGSGGERVEGWETRLTGFTHSGVGRKIAEKWRLAPLTSACIRYHHLSDGVPAEFADEVRIVGLADTAARELGIGIVEADEDTAREEFLLEELGLCRDRFDEILQRYREKAAGTERLFSHLGGMS